VTAQKIQILKRVAQVYLQSAEADVIARFGKINFLFRTLYCEL
jgi:hypothetical protein